MSKMVIKRSLYVSNQASIYDLFSHNYNTSSVAGLKCLVYLGTQTKYSKYDIILVPNIS